MELFGLIKDFISDSRFSNYQDIDEYKFNLYVSKQFYIPLAVLEVSLRNAIDKFLSESLDSHWHEDRSFLTKDTTEKIEQAKEILTKRKEHINKNKIIAELSFGFWVNLFKKPYENKLRINDIKIIFPNLPDKTTMFVNREVIYKKLDFIRNFRNRIFHYEKVVNKAEYNHVEEAIFELLSYFDAQLSEWTKEANCE